MTSDTSEWWEAIQTYLDADQLLHVFPARSGMKFNSDLKPDSYQWAVTTTRLQKEIAFQEYADGNVGCSCQDLVVVDLDMKNGVDGIATWMSWRQENPTPDTWVSKTPSGGLHIFFKLSPEQKAKYQGRRRLRAATSLGFAGSGVDIRTGRSHVMLPSSTFKGGSYEWTVKYHPTTLKMAVAPDWLLGKIAAGDPVTQEFNAIKKKAGKGLNGLLPHIPPASMPKLMAHSKTIGRDNGLFKAGSRWVTECQGQIEQGKMSQEEAADFVWSNLLEYNKVGTNGKPKEQKVIQRIFHSVMKYARQQWNQLPQEGKDAVVVVLDTIPGSKVTEVNHV